MTLLGELGKSVTSVSFTQPLCSLRYLKRGGGGLPQKPLESPLPGTLLSAGVGREPLTGKPCPLSCAWHRCSHCCGRERQVASESQPCPRTPRRQSGSGGWERAQKREPRGGERRRNHTAPEPEPGPPAPLARSAERSTPGAAETGRKRGRERGSPADGSRACQGPRARAARFSEPCAGPSGGNARGRDAVAGRGLGGAGEGGRRRQFGESYRQREWPEPAISLETHWPIAAAEAVYGGGASPWQQKKPLQRLLNAGPGATGA